MGKWSKCKCIEMYSYPILKCTILQKVLFRFVSLKEICCTSYFWKCVPIFLSKVLKLSRDCKINLRRQKSLFKIFCRFIHNLCEILLHLAVFIFIDESATICKVCPVIEHWGVNKQTIQTRLPKGFVLHCSKSTMQDSNA